MRKNKSLRIEVRNEECKILSYLIDEVMNLHETEKDNSATDIIYNLLVSKYGNNLSDYNVN